MGYVGVIVNMPINYILPKLVEIPLKKEFFEDISVRAELKTSYRFDMPNISNWWLQDKSYLSSGGSIAITIKTFIDIATKYDEFGSHFWVVIDFLIEKGKHINTILEMGGSVCLFRFCLGLDSYKDNKYYFGWDRGLWFSVDFMDLLEV